MADKVLHIGVSTLGEALNRFEKVWQQVEKNGKREPEYRLSFASLPQLLSAVTPARLRLLEALRHKGEMTIYELAKRVRRNYKNVHTDIAKLVELGLVIKTDSGKITVPWDSIVAEIRLAA